MAATLQVEVVSPERVLFSGEATMVILRTLGGGDIAFMPGHAPFLGALIEWSGQLHMADGTVKHLAIHNGFVEVSNNTVSILADTAELAEDIDADRAREAVRRAQERLERGDDVAAEADLRRAHARLAAVGGLGASRR
jgi:F-type H+-transporting ATPase subunit epsilon